MRTRAGRQEADREAVEGAPAASRAGPGAAPRPGGPDHGRADGRSRPEPDPSVPREHPAPRPDEDLADLDPHSA